MTYIPILNLIDTKKEELQEIDSNYRIEKRAIERNYELAIQRLEEESRNQKRAVQSQIDILTETIERMSLYNPEQLATTIAKLLSVYEGVIYHYSLDEEGNYLIADDSIKSVQEQQLYAYKLKKDVDKLKFVGSYARENDLAYLPPREHYTNVLYGYDRNVSKVQKTIEDFIDYLFNTRIEKGLKDISPEQLEQILLEYINLDYVIDESVERAIERGEELRVFGQIHERNQTQNRIELPTSYYFKALRELIKRTEADRYQVDHQYIKEDENVTFEMIVKTHEEVLPRIFDSIQVSIGDKFHGNYPKTITFNRIEEHISLLYKYIPRVKRFMENLYSIAVLKRKGDIIVLEERDIEKAYELTVKQKAYALTKVKKSKKGV